MKQGVLLSVGASALFAFMYFYATLMQPFDGDIIFSWRILFGLPMMAIVVQRAHGWRDITYYCQAMQKYKIFTINAVVFGVIRGAIVAICLGAIT